MKTFFSHIAKSSRTRKKIIFIGADILVASMGCYVSFALRYMQGLIETRFDVLVSAFMIAPIFMVISLWVRGVYTFSIRGLGQREIWVIIQAVGVSVFAWGTVVLLLQLSVPRSVILIYGFVGLCGILGVRFLVASMVQRYDPIHGSIAKSKNAIRVLIYGAGVAGRQLLDDLQKGNAYEPVAFVDDNMDVQGVHISGVKVYAPTALKTLIDFQRIQYILLAIPSMSVSDKKTLLQSLEKYNVVVKVLPSVADIIGGKATVSVVREVDIIDLLGREEIPPVGDLLCRDITDKTVLVTGAGGSIGSVLCEKIALSKPKKIIILDSSEYALYRIEQTLNRMYPHISVVAILTSVCQTQIIDRVFITHKVNTVYHAAAYKHVPMVQNNPFVGIYNNVMGTHTVIKSAVQYGIQSFVLVSTDKAVRPTNIMGASKRMAEMVVQAYAEHHAGIMRCSMVRFGNVLGSSGSVIPLFREQIQNGGPVTVTDPEVTRFFMTISEAANLVIQAGAMGDTGDVFVLDMGDSIKIIDLAEKMITLAGFRPYEDIPIIFIGLRSGEKMHEELVLGNAIEPTAHPRISHAYETHMAYDILQQVLDDLQTCIVKGDVQNLQHILTTYVDGYTYDTQG